MLFLLVTFRTSMSLTVEGKGRNHQRDTEKNRAPDGEDGSPHRAPVYGFMANRHRKEKLEQCRVFLSMPEPVPQTEAAPDYRGRAEQLTGVSLRLCPVCRQGTMIPVRILTPAFCRSPFLDSS